MNTTTKTPWALYALTVGAFGIGTTEFVIMGLLTQVAESLNVSIATAGLLISGYAFGVFVGAPLLTIATASLPRKKALLALMAIFTVGNVLCAVAPNYTTLMAARIVTSLAHGTFFGIGSVVATSLVSEDRKASAISIMFTGLTVATLLGVPAGAWLGLQLGWRATFWAVALIGVIAFAVLLYFVPKSTEDAQRIDVRAELKVLKNKQVLLALLATVFGFAGVFAVFTFIQPILMQVTGFSENAVSSILLVFGAGMILGNILGGKLADRDLRNSLLITLTGLLIILGLMGFVLSSKILAVLFVGLLGIGAFATVAPLQMRVLEQAAGEGQNLASSLNIAAFNLGNALGAAFGGWTISSKLGLHGLPAMAGALTVIGIVVVLWSLQLERRRTAQIASECIA